jgi:hypothetical protein
MIVLSNAQKTLWSMADNLRQACLFWVSSVANTFLLTLKDIFSK